MLGGFEPVRCKSYMEFMHLQANNMAPKRQKRTQSQRQLATLSII